MDYDTGMKDSGEMFNFSRDTSSKFKNSPSQCAENQVKVAGSS